MKEITKKKKTGFRIRRHFSKVRGDKRSFLNITVCGTSYLMKITCNITIIQQQALKHSNPKIL